MARRCATSESAKFRMVSVWTLRTPTIRSFQIEWHGQHRGDEPALVEAAHPQEARIVAPTSGITSGSRVCGDAPGDALPEGDLRAPDLVTIEAVRRGERQVALVAIQQVQR